MRYFGEHARCTCQLMWGLEQRIDQQLHLASHLTIIASKESKRVSTSREVLQLLKQIMPQLFLLPIAYYQLIFLTVVQHPARF